MALRCFKHSTQNPFESFHRVFEAKGPEMDSAEPFEGAEGKKREMVAKQIDASELSESAVGKLNEALAKAPEDTLDLWLQNIEQVIELLQQLDTLFAEHADNPAMVRGLKAVAERRAAILGQIGLTLSDIEELRALNEMAEDKIALMEAHLIQDPSKIKELKEHALSFIRRADSTKPLSMESDIPWGVPLVFDFKNPANGSINAFAQKNITLADAMKALGVEELSFRKKGSRTSNTAHLWSDRGVYGEAHSVPNDGAHTATKETYMPVLEGDSFILEAAPTLAKVEAAKPVQLNVSASNTPSLLDMPVPVDGTMTGIPRGAMGFRGQTWDQQMDLYGAPLASPTMTVGVEATGEDYSSLVGTKVTLPKELRDTFRKENAWEEIRNLKYKDQGGDKVYEAVNYLAERRTKDGQDIDNKGMWESMFGIGTGTLTFEQIARAAYGINIGDKRYNNPGKWLVAEYEKSSGTQKAEYGKVLNAADTILTYLPKLKDSGVTADSYEALLASDIPEEMKNASSYTDNFLYDKESAMPLVDLNIMQRVVLAIRGDERPHIGEDNWLEKASREGTRASRKYNQGEVQIISQAEAYDNLMETGSVEAYVEEVNRLMDLGVGQVAAMERRDVSPAHITVEDVNNGVEPNTDQKKAIHYGMALEAAQKLGLYQAAREASLTPEEREARARQQAVGNVYGSGFAAAGVDIGNGGDLNPGVGGGLAGNLNVAPGLTVDAGVTGGLSYTGEELATDADLRFGAKWRSKRLGKNRRWQVGAGVHGGVDLQDGSVGVDANGYVSYDVTKDSVWAAKLGVRAEVGTDAAGASGEVELGMERDFDRQFQVFLGEYKEKNAAQIAEYKTKAHEAIDASPYDAATKTALKQASDALIDRHVEEAALEAWTKGFRQIKLAGFGVAAGADLNLKKFLKNGLRIGPFVTIAFGFRSTTLYVETPTAVGGGESPDIADYIPVDSDMVAVTLPESELYIGGAAERQEAIARASTKIEAARNARDAALAETMQLSPVEGVPYNEVYFPGLEGHVKLYIDGDIEAMTDGGANYLNVGLESNMSIFIDETKSAQTRGNTYEIYISTNPEATRESIKAASETHLEWIQTPGGTIGSSRIVNQTDDSSFYTLAGAMDAGVRAKDRDPASYVDEVTREDLLRQTAARDSTLFDEYSEADFLLAEKVGAELIASGFKYDDFALGNKDAEITAAIKAIYISNGLEEAKINIDRIYMARQHAMELGRPSNLEVPMEWNSDAFEKLAGTASHLYTDYMTSNRETIEKGGLNGALPVGSEFYISVSNKGVARGEALLLGYYDQRLHGNILAQVEWDSSDPDSTLRTLGAPLTEENRKGVIAVAEAIRSQAWPESPFNTLEEASFEKAKYTIAGELLLTNAEELYGAEKGAKLRAIAAGTSSSDPVLEAEFLADVAELLTTHTTMVGETPVIMEMEVRSGLYEKCYNLVISRNFRLNYQKPQEKAPEITVERRERYVGLREEEAIDYHTVEVTAGIPTVEKKTSKKDEDEEGDGLQDEGGDEGDQLSGEEEESSDPGDHPSI